MINRPMFLIGISAFIWLFILSSLQNINLARLAFVLFIIAALLSFLFLKGLKNKRLYSALAGIFIALAGFSLLFIGQSKLIYEPSLKTANLSDIKIEARIVGAEQKINDRYYYILKTESIDGQDFKVKIRFLSQEKLNYEPLTKLSIEAKKTYLLADSDSIWHTSKKADGVYIGAYGQITDAKKPESKTPLYYILNLQEKIKTKILKTIPSQEGAVLLGILLGNTSYINDSTYRDFRASGVTHLFSVSGLHISLWSLFLAFILKRFNLPPKIRGLISIGFLIFIVSLTGFSPSAIRAGIMMAILFLGDLISRDADSLNSLGLAVLVMLMANPFAACSISLILSFSATFGILVFYKGFEEFFARFAQKIKNKHIKKGVQTLIDSFSISFSVILTSLPWLAYFFGTFSIISPLANLLLVIPAEIAMILVGAAMVFLPVKFIFYPLITLAGLVSKYILSLAGLFAKIPYAQISIQPFLFALSAGLSLVFTLIYIKKAKDKSRVKQYTLLVFSLLLITSNLVFDITPKKTAKIIIPAIGNNSSVLLVQGNKSALFACGGSDSALSFALNSKNIRELDFLALPRMSKTESQAAGKILTNFEPKTLLCAEDFLLADEDFKHDDAIFSNDYETEIFNEINLAYKNSEDFSAIKIESNGTRLIVCYLPISDFKSMPISWQEADILICRAAIPKSLNPLNFKHVIINTNKNLADDSPEHIQTTSPGEISITLSPKGQIKLA